MPKNINSITINIFLEGIEKIKTKKKWQKKQSEQFSGLKYILARQNLHFSPQNAPQKNARQSDNNI